MAIDFCRVKKRYKVFIALTVFILFFTAACGTTYEPGEVPARISAEINEITFREGPLTVPVKPGEELVVQTSFEKPSARRYQMHSLDKQWFLNGELLSESSDSITLTVSDTTDQLTVKTVSYWEVDEAAGRRYISDTHSLDLFIAVAQRRQPGQNSIDGYSIGHFPDVSGDYSRWQDNLVILQSNTPFKVDENIAKQLSYGNLVKPVEKNGEVVSRDDELKVIYENQRGWIPKKNVALPHSIALFPQLYEEPSWYYPVTEENRGGYVLPNLPWEQFDHDEYYREKLNPQFPHYIPLDRRMITELHHFQQALRGAGYSSRIELICGSRNPFYNQGEREKDGTLKALYSRHQYGDAVDLIVDGALNGRLDDITGDGRITIEDADALMEIAEDVRKKLGYKGGIGTYRRHDVPERLQTPYLHLDLRGLEARWRVP